MMSRLGCRVHERGAAKPRVAIAALALAFAAGAINGCANMDDEEALLLESSGVTGSAALALEVAPGVTIKTVKAILETPTGKTQEHTINVEPPGSSPTIYFRLPVATGYKVTLKAQAKDTVAKETMDCESQPVPFNITANSETAVNVPVVCLAPGAIATGNNGTAKVTGTFTVSHESCDPILAKVVISPASITSADVPVKIEAYPRSKVKDATIDLTVNKGTLADDDWNKWSYTCGSATGAASFTITAEANDCTETGTLLFTCPGGSGGPTCGDGVITAPEVCDTNGASPDILPSGTPAGSSCNATCSAIVPPAGPTCGDGVITAPEACDTNGNNPDVLPSGTPAGSTCNSTCSAIVPPTSSSCGDGVITAPEVCDTNGSNPDVLPSGTPAGSTCNSTCTVIIPPPVCGNGAIEAPEVCDTNGSNPDVLPSGTPTGSTCNATCTAIVPPAGASCGDGVITAPEACDTNGSNPDVLPSGTAAGSTCNTTCTAIVPPTSGGSGTCHATCVEDLVNNGACNGVFTPVGADSDPVIDCVLGQSWPTPNTFPAGSCANGNLLACYCGSLDPSACLTALPANLTGACTNQILAATGCSAQPAAAQSQCVGQNFVNPGNAAGRALAYVQCLQDNCPDICFAP
jgi:hypothetical protein